MDGMIGSGKVYTHNTGLSCAFRQWKAESHCRYLHGYSLRVEIQFIEVAGLSKEGWVVDFGGLREVKDWLDQRFNHKTIVAQDDPERTSLQELAHRGVLDIVIVERVGCESFVMQIVDYVNRWLKGSEHHERVVLNMVKVSEHDGNYAFWSAADEQEE